MKKLALLLALCLVLASIPAFAPAEGLTIEELESYEALRAEASPVDGEVGEQPEGALPIPNDGETRTPHTDPLGPVLAANTLTLGVDEKFALKPVLPMGVTGGFVCDSSHPDIATVTESGSVLAISRGTAVITVTADSGAYTECIVTVKSAPKALAFDDTVYTFGVGERANVTDFMLVSATGEWAGAIQYQSSDPRVFSVDAEGVLMGVKCGNATLSAISYNGLRADCTVTVMKAPSMLSVSVDHRVLGVGEYLPVDWAVPEDAASRLTYTSSAPHIASVDETGAITGEAPGRATVRATTYNGKTAKLKVKVEPTPNQLSFDVSSVRLGVGMKLPLAASVDAGAHDRIEYTLTNEDVASYSRGKLKGLAKGRTVLVAHTYNGLTARCKVTVVAAPKRVKLPYETLNIGLGTSFKLEPDIGKSASTYTFKSSNKQIVSVDANGVVTGLLKGSATITVKTYNGKKTKVKVNVINAPRWIKLSPESAEISVGQTVQLAYSLPEGSAGTVTFSSDNESVAKVDPASGFVTAVSDGEAAITATTHNGKKATAFIKVYPLPEWIEVEPGIIEMAVGMTRTLKVKLSPGSRSPVTFTSAIPSVAKVSDTGVITARKKGQTTVSVETLVPDVNSVVSVTVKAAPRKVSLGNEVLTLNIGETTRLNPVIPKNTLTEFTYESSNSAVATVSDEGMVTAVGRGMATLKVRTHNGKEASLALTVVDPYYPEKVVLNNAPEMMQAGTTLQLDLAVTPETSVPGLVWSTTNENVAYVDGNDVLHAVGYGYATLSATSSKNADIKLAFTVSVETEEVVLTIPARITGIEDIPHNLQLIEALHDCAVRQIGLLYVSETITKDDALKRKSMVDNAFKDYAFPWMTPTLQKYWKAENSEGGVKDFKPNQVYYGIPYISGSGTNRQYNVAKELSEGRYTDTGEGYYLLNQDRLLNGKYCGNDCSCFVDAAIWGTGSSHSADRTSDIAVSSAYKTVNSLRTGDLICKGYAHVVMFLYYANPEKTKIMIIENGGIEPGTNTVHCMVMDLDYYKSRGYKVRRLASLG